MSKAVGVRELKTRLGRYLRAVRQGQTIVVTDRGEPVAELRPIVLAKSSKGTELDRLVALGRLTRKSEPSLAPFRPIKRKGSAVSDALIEDREDRF